MHAPETPFMRTIHWLFAVSVALFVVGIGFVVAGARTMRQATPIIEASIATPVATVQQIMNGITDPAATVVYDSVGSISDASGVRDVAPRDDAEWAKVANSAAVLAESGNVLMMPGHAVDTGDWVTIARDMTAAAAKALKAAEAKDRDGLLAAGSELSQTCDNCHAKYQRQ
jgi:hypothetical protein